MLPPPGGMLRNTFWFMDKGEFELIDAIKSRFAVPAGVLGIGDDCAVLPQRGGHETLVTADMLVEGVHFLKEAHPFDIGWKSVAANLSDVAAMGGTPVGTFLSVALPPWADSAWVEKFMDGYSELSGMFGVPLLGGDTCASTDRLCINVTVLGECMSGRALKRSSARPGDLIYLGAAVGDSAAGLRIVLGGGPGNADEREEVSRHWHPFPQIGLGTRLAAMDGVHAMMDVSDGVASDLRHIMRESSVGACVEVKRLPMSGAFRRVCAAHGWDAEELALCGGEDYVLLFTADPACDLAGEGCFPIGRVTEEAGLRWIGREGEDFLGFRHF